MTTGLVIGKFLPVHEGHLALIRFAAAHCDRLVVSMSYTQHDGIAPPLRISWLKEALQDDRRIECYTIVDDFDDDQLPLEQRTAIWANVLRARYGVIDLVVSSESYGEPLARHLQATHLAFDPPRVAFPVSGTAIRHDPYTHWNFIPAVVKPHFVKKICFYGPESTGKSVMAKHMAARYHTEFVPEVAREMITSNSFNREDIIAIGRAQTQRVFQKLRTANKLLFCDTDLITTEIYSRHYLKVVPPVLYELEKMITYDRYFLFDIDVPWVNDGLRDLGTLENRRAMYLVFKEELERRGIPYVSVHGTWEEREQIIQQEISRLMQPVS